MIAPLLLSLIAAARPLPAPQQSPAAAVPAPPPALPPDWSALPPLRYRRPPEVPPSLAGFAAGEVAAGRCPPQRGRTMRVEMAVLAGPEGAARVVPRAVGCATVEQYAAGLVSRFARENVEPDGEPGWHVTRIDIPLSPPGSGQAAPVPPELPGAPPQP